MQLTYILCDGVILVDWSNDYVSDHVLGRGRACLAATLFFFESIALISSSSSL